MADDEITKKQAGSITQTADDSQERISQVSNVNRTISEMQRKVDRQLDEAEANFGDIEGIEKVQSSFSKVLNEFSNTVSSIGNGFAKIAGDTARAGKDTVKQYGKAISQDISYNKQNIVSLALSRTSPIFGYFAGKFMETDVFQSAKEKMKANLSNALGGVTAKLKEGWASLFKRNKEKAETEKPVKNYSKITEKIIIEQKGKGEGATATEIAEKVAEIKKNEKIPKMQTGGYVEKSGLVSLHAGEVVAPIEKILDRIDESISIGRDLAALTRKAQLNTLGKMGTFVKSSENLQKVGLAKGFLRALTEVNTQYTEPAQQRMLRAVLSIQDSMGATIGTWPQVWQKMLVNHPTFRNIMFSLKGLSSILGVPAKLTYQIFKSRGGYASHLSRAKNPMEAAAENIGLVYSEGMSRLDNIANYTKATAEASRDMSSAITGKKYAPLEGVPRGIWSIFGITRSLTNWIGKHGVNLFGRILGGSDFAKTLTEFMTKQRELPFERFFKSGQSKVLEKLYDDRGVSDLRPEAKEAGSTGESLVEVLKSVKANIIKTKDKEEEVVSIISELKEKSTAAADDYAYETKKVVNGIDRIVSISQSTNKTTKDAYKSDEKKSAKIINLTKKIQDAAEENAEANKESNFREKRRSVFGFVQKFLGMFGGGGIFALLSFAGSFLLKGVTKFLGGTLIKGLIGSIFRGVGGTFLGPILTKMFGPKSLLITGIKSLATSFAASKIGTTLISALKNPAVWGVASKAVGVAAAAGIGWQVGKQLDSWIGISERFQKSMNKWGAEARKLADEMTSHQMDLSKSAREGGEKGFKAKKTLSLESSLLKGGTGKDKMESVGFFGRSNINAINAGQVEYLKEHAGEYLMWDADTIDRMRKQWMTSPEAYGAKLPGTDAIAYGKRREKSFLNYLKQNATKLTEEGMAKERSVYEAGLATGREPQEVVEQTNMAAQLKIRAIELKNKLLNKEKEEELRKKAEETTKTQTKAMVQSFSRTTAAITNITTNNDQKTWNSNSGGNAQQNIGWGRGAYSYTFATIRGDTDED